jgi:hypothetical protein
VADGFGMQSRGLAQQVGQVPYVGLTAPKATPASKHASSFLAAVLHCAFLAAVLHCTFLAAVLHCTFLAAVLRGQSAFPIVPGCKSHALDPPIPPPIPPPLQPPLPRAPMQDRRGKSQFITHMKKNEAASEFARSKTLAEQRRFLPVYGVREEMLQVSGQHPAGGGGGGCNT